MKQKEWSTAVNLKLMLREGKTFMEITFLRNCNQVFENRIKNIIEEFIKHVSLSEIQYCIEEMEVEDKKDYNKITAALIKRFSNESVNVTITISPDTITKYHHEDPLEETSEKTITLMMYVAISLLLLLATYWYFTKDR